jgi:hypothetical protein
MLSYEQIPHNREGLKLIAGREFVFTDDNHVRYETPALQQAKAKVVLDALDAQLNGPDAPTDDIKRMLLEYETYWKWRDSITIWTNLSASCAAHIAALHPEQLSTGEVVLATTPATNIKSADQPIDYDF